MQKEVINIHFFNFDPNEIIYNHIKAELLLYKESLDCQ
jgi:hypothetical protein